jgi:predicted Ser/Thr protein kinase/Tfp pilus assembly protein PilF
MGTVFRAYQKELKRTVALKVLRGGDEETRLRFVNEAQLAARLRHPNIVSVYEIGRAHNVPYMAMEFVQGKPLDEQGRLAFRRGAEILRDVAQAVHYAHERGIIHRDLKPQNILIDGENRPYVTDFGLARPIEGAPQLTGAGVVVGTPSYMSAEQARGDRDLDGRSDVASLGSVLYEVAVGKSPYPGATPVDVALAVIHQAPAPPRRLRPEVPADLEAVIVKAMAKDRNQRYPTAKAFAEDLQRFLEGEPVSAQRPGVVSSALRRLTRNRKRGALALASVAAAAVLLVGLVLSLRENRAHKRLLEAAALEKRGELEKALALYEGHAAEAERVRAALESRHAETRRASARTEAEAILASAGPGTPAQDRATLATRALSLDPDLERAFVIRALAHQELGNDAAAYEDLGRAAERSSSPLPHVMSRADLARRMGRVPDEIADLSRAIELNAFSGDLRLYRAWARARLARERLSGAAADVVQLVTSAEEDLARAGRHALLEGVETFLRDLLADMARAPAPARREFAAAYAGRAYAGLAAGDALENATRWAERAVDSDSGYAPAYAARGACRLSAGRAVEARSDAEWSLQLLPRLPEALAVRGLSRVHQALRDVPIAPAVASDVEPPWAAEFVDGWTDAQDYLEHAPRKSAFPALEAMAREAQAALRGKETLARYLSGRLARRAATIRLKKDFACAVGLLNRALALDDRNVAAYLERAESRFQSEEFGPALSDWERAAALDPSLRGGLDPRIREARTRLGGG